MANKVKAAHEQDPEAVIESAIGRTEGFIMNNGRSLLIALVVVVVAVSGYFGYKYLVVAPRAEKASAAMYVAEQQFAANSYELALNGDGNYDGFLTVISKYGSSLQANLAKHYAGICYLQLADYQNALKYLKEYKPTSDAAGAIIKAQNIGLQGDVNAQLENYKEAAALYEKAVASSENSLTAPYYLKKSGLVYEKLGDNAKALAAYNRVKNDYSSSLEARDIQKFIGSIEQL